VSPQALRNREARASEMSARHAAKAARLEQGLGCMACGFMPPAHEYFAKIQAHHVRPVRNGGTFRDGLALLCKRCHRTADELAGSDPSLELGVLPNCICASR
jgi:hypothetical protein